jgi:hypothetical protein
MNADCDQSLGRFLPGFTGILVDPIQGAVDDRAKGFAKGFVSGTLGVLFKPGAGELSQSTCAYARKTL